MPSFSAKDTADYISDLTQELAGLARASRLDVLASILDIAALEAGQAAIRLAERRTSITQDA